MTNLDRLAAETSQLILDSTGASTKGEKLQAKDLERLTTNALGVLQEQGVYALFLYLLSRSGDKAKKEELAPDEFGSCVVLAHLVGLLNRLELESLNATFADGWDRAPAQINDANNKKALLSYASEKIAADLLRLLLVKSLFEQVLIYTRYGAKAMVSSAPEDISAPEGTSAMEGTS